MLSNFILDNYALMCYVLFQVVKEKESVLFQLRRWPDACEDRYELSASNFVQLTAKTFTVNGELNSTYLLAVEAGDHDYDYKFKFIEEDYREGCNDITSSVNSVNFDTLFRLTYNVYCLYDSMYPVVSPTSGSVQ